MKRHTYILYCMLTSGSDPDWYDILMSRSRLFFAFGAHVTMPFIFWLSETVIVEGV